jgi:hypothetical protein
MFGPTMRLALSMAAMAMAVTILPVLTAPPAAADGCGGNLVRVKGLFMPDGTRIGELQIFYNPTNDNNCAEMHHGGPTWGVVRDTWVYIAKCQQTAPGNGCTEVQDDHRRNDVGFWVGPAIVTNAGNHCIVANGWIFWQGQRRKVHTDGPTLCG